MTARRGRLLLAAGLALAAPWPGAAASAVIDVPSGGDAFAAAVAAAAPGDTLRLGVGVHRGPVVVDRPLHIAGAPGAVVDGGGEGSVITVSTPGVTLRGLLVRNSGASLETMDSGIFIEKTGDGAVVADNEFTHNLFAVYLHGPDAAVVRGNRITGRDDLRMNERGNGVQVWNSPGSVVEGNDVALGRDGIFVTTSRGNIFRGNRFRDLRFAIHYMNTDDAEVSGNVSIGNHVGYALMYAHRLIVRGNLSQGDRDHGILLNYANSSVIEDNMVRDGGTKCVFIYNSSKNTFRGNRFERCEIGIHFTAGSERNSVTENAFIHNRSQVKYVGTRWLDWSADGRGNYWSDAPAFDLNGDGIADSAYQPNDLIDRVIWTHPLAKLLVTSPAVQLVRWAQSEFPALHPGGVIDSAPLMTPPSAPVFDKWERNG